MNKEKIAEIREDMKFSEMVLKNEASKSGLGTALMILGITQRKFSKELTEDEIEIIQIQQSIDNLRDELVNKISE